ncbi:hypothetical protein GGR57DRAFT_509459 [Xylariaceae sp. FL1272]|nr:hypothetical protein GGR57DRAFT_509459 [Xylariaceae sp. FL1272]
MSKFATEGQHGGRMFDNDQSRDNATRSQQMLKNLIIDVDKEDRTFANLKGNKCLREAYQSKVYSLISAGGNFVHDVLGHKGNVMNEKTNEEVMFRMVHKKFLLDIAIREKVTLLAEPAHGTRRTAFHMAVEVDQNLEIIKPEFSFTLLFCDIMEDMIAHKKMTQQEAATVISMPSCEGDTCLHDALRADLELDVASRLIELADEATFKKSGRNGNTPLHNALEFPLPPFDQKNLIRHRYLVQAPRCPTPSRRTPVGVSLPSRTSQPSDCCAGCWAADERYGQVKERRCRIIRALIDKYPAALTICNKAGKSPFSYHVMAREALKAIMPNLSLASNQRELLDQQLEKSTISLVRSLVFKQGDIQESDGPGASSPVLVPASGASIPKSTVDGAQLARVDSIRTSRGSISLSLDDPIVERTGQNATALPTAKPDCTPKVADWYELSVEIEKFLWDTAFRIGEYSHARLCLFPSPCAGPANSVEDPPDLEKRHEIFIPTRRISANTSKLYRQWKFLPALAYVHLRATPDQEDKDPSGTADGRENWTKTLSDALKSLFRWLTKTKGVKRIVMLVVEDNDLFPCSEAAMRDCLRKLDEVRYLDWRRPDVSVPTLREAKNVTELWLYSTGLNAVLSGWSDKGGLQTLDKVVQPTMPTAVGENSQSPKLLLLTRPATAAPCKRNSPNPGKQGMETTDGNKANVERFQKELNKWYDKREAPKVVVKGDSTGPTGGNVPVREGELDDNRSNPWIDKVKDWITELRNNSVPKALNDESDGTTIDEDECATSYIKVALLDDGVDPEYDGLGKFMSGSGWPRPSEAPGKHKQPESFFSAGARKHGNNMAQLLVMICPFVSLYVAKINASGPTEPKHHPTFDIAQGTQAIWWAIREKVDIISMSWNVLLSENDEDKKDLEKAIKEARDRGILLYCAASEKKQTMPNKKAYPSVLSQTFSIGAASENQRAYDYVGESRFLFPSDHNGDDGGSSAATAIAAGLASLILYSLRQHNRETKRTDLGRGEKTWGEDGQGQPSHLPLQKQESLAPAVDEDRYEMMGKVFDSLCRDRSNYVEIDELLGKDKGPATYETIARRCQAFQAHQDGLRRRA